MNVTEISQKITSVLDRSGAKFAYLYGSVAKGVDTSESDIDIAVSFDLPKDTAEDKIDYLLVDVAAKLGVDTRQVDLKLFESLPLPVSFRVIRDGKLMYVKDKSYQLKNAVSIVSRYHDELPFFKAATKEFFSRSIK